MPNQNNSEYYQSLKDLSQKLDGYYKYKEGKWVLIVTSSGFLFKSLGGL